MVQVAPAMAWGSSDTDGNRAKEFVLKKIRKMYHGTRNSKFQCFSVSVFFKPKTEIEPQWERSGHGRTLHPHIEAKYTDHEEVVETIFKPVWCILKSVYSVYSVVKTPTNHYCNFGVQGRLVVQIEDRTECGAGPRNVWHFSILTCGLKIWSLKSVSRLRSAP